MNEPCTKETRLCDRWILRHCKCEMPKSLIDNSTVQTKRMVSTDIPLQLFPIGLGHAPSPNLNGTAVGAWCCLGAAGPAPLCVDRRDRRTLTTQDRAIRRPPHCAARPMRGRPVRGKLGQAAHRGPRSLINRLCSTKASQCWTTRWCFLVGCWLMCPNTDTVPPGLALARCTR